MESVRVGLNECTIWLAPVCCYRHVSKMFLWPLSSLFCCLKETHLCLLALAMTTVVHMYCQRFGYVGRIVTSCIIYVNFERWVDISKSWRYAGIVWLDVECQQFHTNWPCLGNTLVSHFIVGRYKTHWTK